MITHKEWIDLDIFHPEDTYQDWRTVEWYEYYKYKNHYAKIAHPTRMLEIGVRLGYSAYAFTCDNQVGEYVGLDIQLPLDGGMPFKTFNWVRSKVVPKAPQTKFTFLECNTQEGIPSLGQFDLIHVDGDHSYEGALRDMNNCWPLLNHGGLMIVDDYSFIAGVKWACDAWAEMQDALLLIGPSKRGDALFWKT